MRLQIISQQNGLYGKIFSSVLIATITFWSWMPRVFCSVGSMRGSIFTKMARKRMNLFIMILCRLTTKIMRHLEAIKRSKTV